MHGRNTMNQVRYQSKGPLATRSTGTKGRMMCPPLLGMLAAVVIVCGTSPHQVRAQADYFEGFENVGPVLPGDDGPSHLIDAGWIFSNQSDPAPGVAWYPGDGFGGQPFEGAGYLASSSSATDYFGGPLSAWAVLPDLPDLQAGDTFSIWIYGGGSFTYDTFFEIRHSPGGGADTGAGPTDVGDFTEELYSTELPLNPAGYQQVTVTVPGTGRLAMRFRAPFIMSAFGRGAVFSIDSLSVGGPPPPPCGIPIPQPGETATWGLAASPYVVCQDLAIPAGAAVIVEPGVTISFDPDVALTVLGGLSAQGTPEAPIVFTGASGFAPALESLGDVEIAYADISVRIAANDAGSLVVRDANIVGGGVIEGVGRLGVIERCVFAGGDLQIVATVRLADCEFSGGATPTIGGLVFVDNVTVDGQPLTIEREPTAQATLIDNVSVTDYPGGAGLRVRGANYLIGPNTILQGNLYPVEFFLTGGGLLSGSTLPLAGNIRNYIPTGELITAADRYWANVGLPYVVSGFPQNHDGTLTIEPGTTVQLHPGAGAFFVIGSSLIARGTPEQPIVFEEFTPGAGWHGFQWVQQFTPVVRHAVFRDATLAVNSDESQLMIEECTFQQCDVGTGSSTSGQLLLRKSRLLDNVVGMSTTATGHIDAAGALEPNAFEGNALAVDYNNTTSAPDFTYNWWNSPTGPTSPQNPDGTGDPVEGLAASWFTPFLTAPPDFIDHLPNVELVPMYFLINSGEKVIVRWTASDDIAIASQRIEYAPYGFNYETIATLGPEQRSYEFTAPVVPPSNLSTNASGLRVVVIDTTGQDSFDQARFFIPYQEDITPVERTISGPEASVSPGETVDVCWDPPATSDAAFLLDADGLYRGIGGGSDCLPIGARAPWVSTDRARIAIRTTYGAGGREVWSFSDYFEIRPDGRYGDAPPAVSLESPQPGDQFIGGTVVPVQWTAADDEGLRAFHLAASYDNGKTWHFVAQNLAGTAREFAWLLPPSAGIDAVRLRVTAVDARFQNSNDGDDIVFSVLPGNGAPLGDMNCDGGVNAYDIDGFVCAVSAQCDYEGMYPDCDRMLADTNGDGAVDAYDIDSFIALVGGG